MIVADQIIAHAVGDYVLQSDWMANEKTSKSVACLAHAFVYTLCFLLLTQSPTALFIIFASHFVMDRWRLARYVCYAKNFLSPRRCWKKWEDCKGTGYHKDTPPFMATWLMIIADNVIHIICNAAAIYFFG